MSNHASELPYSTQSSSSSPSIQKQLIGIALVLSVAIIWVASSVLIQAIFGNNDHDPNSNASFDKPFFLTYFSVSLFSFFLVGFLISDEWKDMWRNRHYYSFQDETTSLTPGQQSGTRIQQHNPDNTALLTIGNHHPSSSSSGRKPQILTSLSHDGYDSESDQAADPESRAALSSSAILTPQPSSSSRLNIKQVLLISVMFSPLWFISNYCFNLGLVFTSVSSSSTISTLSGLFTLVLGHVSGIESFSLVKMLAVLLNMCGVSTIFFSDFKDAGSSSLGGDIATLIGSITYACYTVLLKFKIKDDQAVSMPMFLGFIGAFTLCCGWPGLVVLHVLGVESFQWPSLKITALLLCNGVIGSMLSDYLWARSVLLTTPLISTLAISMTIPLSVLADSIFKSASFNFVYLVGLALVAAGFIIANVDECALRRQEMQD